MEPLNWAAECWEPGRQTSSNLCLDDRVLINPADDKMSTIASVNGHRMQ